MRPRFFRRLAAASALALGISLCPSVSDSTSGVASAQEQPAPAPAVAVAPPAGDAAVAPAPAPAPAPVPAPAPGTPGFVCPDAVMLVARGSGETQQPPTVLPSGATLNGWEGRRLRPLLERLDTNNVAIIALPADHYEANPFWTEIYKAGVRTSAVGGARSAVEAAVRYEDHTGCRPSYILIGYSQGAMALGMAERALGLSGRVAGSVYVGDPYLEPHDPALIGTPTGGRGIMYQTGPLFSSTAFRVSPDVVEYCEEFDPVCDDTRNAVDQLQSGAVQPHLTYFQPDVSPERAAREQIVVDRINQMVARARTVERLKLNAGSMTPPSWRLIMAGPPVDQRSSWASELIYQFIADGIKAADHQSKLINATLNPQQQPVTAQDAQLGFITVGAAIQLLGLAQGLATGGSSGFATALSSTPETFLAGLAALNQVAATFSAPGSLLYGTNLSSWASSDITLLTSLSATGSALSTGSL